MDKLVSVIIPTYRRPAYLRRAIDSVLNSSYKNVEVLVVDDNNDGDEYRLETSALMECICNQHANVIYLKHQINRNGSAARNTGFRHSSGDYIMFLDDDDEFLPGKIEKQVLFLESNSDQWAACYTKYLDVFQNGKIRKGIEHASGDLYLNELARNLFVHAGSNLMIRRKVVEEINGFNESFQRNQDIEFLVRILKNYNLGFVDCIGLKVYLHPRKEMDFNEITRKYIKAFSDDINGLAETDRQRIYKMIGLQLIRFNLLKGDFKVAMTEKKQYGISFRLVYSYFFHLLKRAITRTAYSFPMEKL